MGQKKNVYFAKERKVKVKKRFLDSLNICDVLFEWRDFEFTKSDIIWTRKAWMSGESKRIISDKLCFVLNNQLAFNEFNNLLFDFGCRYREVFEYRRSWDLTVNVYDDDFYKSVSGWGD